MRKQNLRTDINSLSLNVWFNDMIKWINTTILGIMTGCGQTETNLPFKNKIIQSP
jgi:hypothetical protein